MITPRLSATSSAFRGTCQAAARTVRTNCLSAFRTAACGHRPPHDSGDIGEYAFYGCPIRAGYQGDPQRGEAGASSRSVLAVTGRYSQSHSTLTDGLTESDNKTIRQGRFTSVSANGGHQISERRLLQYLKRVLKRLGFGRRVADSAQIKHKHGEPKNVTSAKQKPSTDYVDGFLSERRARDSNPQPVSRHHISSVAASHSLTLRRPAPTCSRLGS